MATRRFIIEVRAEGARKVQSDVDKIGRSGDNAAKKTSKLTKALRALGAAVTVRGIFRLGVEFQRLERRILAVSDSSAEFAKNFALVRQVSEETRSDISTNAATFQKLSIATDSMGLSSSNTAKILKTLNQSLAIGGATANEARNALLQLGQGLSSGNLQGDELRTLRESAAFLSSVLAEKLGVDGIGALKELGSEGKLTSDVLVGALLEAAEEIDAKFQDLPETFEEAFTKLLNSLKEFGGELGPVLATMTDGLNKIAATISLITAKLNVASARAAVERTKSEQSAGTPGFVPERQGLDAQRRNVANFLGFRDPGEVSKEAFDAFREEAKKAFESAEQDLAAAFGRADARGIASAQIRVESTSRVLELIGEETEKTTGAVTAAQKDLQDALLELDQAQKNFRTGGRAGTTTKQVGLNPDSQDEPIETKLAPFDFKKFVENEKEAFAEFKADAAEAFADAAANFKLLENITTSVFGNMADAVAEFARTGKFSFKSFATSVVDDLLRILQQALITQAVAGLLGDGPTKNTVTAEESAAGTLQGLLSGVGFALRATGGPVSGNEPVLVGERGPELFVPTGQGNIIPNVPSAAPPVINVVNVMDPNDIAAAISGGSVDREIINVVSRNKEIINRS